jgi:hypothetical protein
MSPLGVGEETTAKSKRHVGNLKARENENKSNLINGAVHSRADLGGRISKSVVGMGMFLIGLLVSFSAFYASAQTSSILNGLGTPQVLSTVPSNGDVNPYGVAFVPKGFLTGGLLDAGDIVISN